jgi:hypothetical protein
MKALSTGLCTVVAFLLISFQRPIQAQTVQAQPVEATTGSDIAAGVTLTGTVQSVLLQAAPGMIVGSHLLLATPRGPVDASLGRFGLQGEGALSVAAGQQIEATGVMKRINEKTVFLVRSVKVDGFVYVIRNKHGLPVSPRERKRASEKGESL